MGVMREEIGRVVGLFRYPVKSMAGEALAAARLGWHGLAGDRRFAFRRVGETAGFPWLTASRLAELVRYRPERADPGADEELPTHVVTPEGERLELRGAALRERLSERFGGSVELLRLDHGIFDEAAVSVLSMATLTAVSREASLAVDPRRYRPNILIETSSAGPFGEDGWVGARLRFGREAAVSVTLTDTRCVMVNLDPDNARADADMLKAVVRMNGGNAGVYATVVGCGEIRIGDAVQLETSGDRES